MPLACATTRLGVRSLGNVRDRQLVECRQPGRRTGRTGRRLSDLCHRRRGAGHLCQWPASGQHYLNIPHIAGAGEMVVIAAGMAGGCLASYGSTATRPRSSWATPARCRWVDCWDFWPCRAAGIATDRHRRSVCRRSRQRDPASGLVSLDEEANFSLRHCTITSSSKGGPNTRSRCDSGSPRRLCASWAWRASNFRRNQIFPYSQVTAACQG